MNKTLALMINSIEPKHNKERAHNLAEGLLAIRHIFRDMPFDFNEQVNYVEAYKHAHDSLKGSALLHRLEPVRNGYMGSYEVKGGDFTLCFWMFMVAEIVEFNPQDVEAWVRFGNKMNDYMYDVDSYAKHMLSNTAIVDRFPIAKLLSNFAIYTDVTLPKIALNILKCDMLLHTLVKATSQDSLNRILQRLNYLMVMETSTWLEIGDLFRRLDGVYKIYHREPEYDSRQIRKCLLFSSNPEETFTYIKRNLNGIISEIQEADEEMREHDELSRSVLLDFVKRSDPTLAPIFDSEFNPTNVSLPLNSLQTKLLLLSKHSLSKTRPSFYEGYSNAQSIYMGQPDHDYELSAEFRRELHAELFALAVAGYTGVIGETGLIFSS